MNLFDFTPQTSGEHFFLLVLRDLYGSKSLAHMQALSLSKNVSYVGTANESDDSPFKGMVSLPDTPEGDRVVVPAAIEAAIAYIQSKKIRQLSNEDSEYEFFISIWSKIKATWPAAFGKNSKLLSKVGILCMTRYVTDTVDFIVSFTGPELNLSNSEDVAIAVGRVLDLQSEQFWLVEWSISISDSKAVRDEIDEALKSIQQNIRYKQPWFTELKILKAGIQQKSADNPQPGQA